MTDTTRRGIPMAFDYEGVAKRRVDLLEIGVCRGVVYDSQTAARDGVASTGHGLPAPNPWGPFPLNMLMAPGDEGRDDLIARPRPRPAGHALPLHEPGPPEARDHHRYDEGRHVPRRGRADRRAGKESAFYAVAISTLWRVQSGVARERKTLKGFLGGVVVPALRLDGWTFTGRPSTDEHTRGGLLGLRRLSLDQQRRSPTVLQLPDATRAGRGRPERDRPVVARPPSRRVELPEFKSSRWAAMLATVLILAVAACRSFNSTSRPISSTRCSLALTRPTSS